MIDRRRPEPLGTRTCRFCHARIVIVRDSEGVNQALDVTAPVYRLRPNEHGDRIAVRMSDVFVSHWSTCAGRDQAKKLYRGQRRARRKQARDAALTKDTEREMGIDPARRGQDVGAK